MPATDENVRRGRAIKDRAGYEVIVYRRDPVEPPFDRVVLSGDAIGEWERARTRDAHAQAAVGWFGDYCHPATGIAPEMAMGNLVDFLDRIVVALGRDSDAIESYEPLLDHIAGMVEDFAARAARGLRAVELLEDTARVQAIASERGRTLDLHLSLPRIAEALRGALDEGAA